jgi:non-reducing end alpha-L-arabinofuranosidase
VGQGGTSTSGGGSSKGGSGGAGGSSGKGGAAGGSTTPAVTDIDGSKTIGSLSPTDAAKLCSDTNAYFGKVLSQADLCKWAGLAYGVSSAASDSNLQRNCKSQESSCLQASAADAKCSPIPASCSATVSQYSDCIVAEAAAFNRALGALPGCATVTVSDLSGVWDYMTSDPPEACVQITNKCPGYDIPAPRPPTSSPGTGGSGGAVGSGGTTAGAGGGTGTGGAGGITSGTGGKSTGGAGGATAGTGGSTRAGGASGGTGGTGGGTTVGGAGGTTGLTDGLPGDVAKAAGTPFVAAHAMTRALFASYKGPLFKALRDSDKEEKDIGFVASTGLVDMTALNSFCSGTTCKVTTLYDQSGNGNDMWRGDVETNAPMDNGEAPKLCDLMAIEYMSLSDGSKLPIAVETGAMWKSKAQCLRNRDKTKNMPTGATPQTTYAIFHAKYLNNNCCFNYGNTGKRIHYTGPGTLSALNFSKIEFWSKGTGSGPWVMVDWEQGVYAGNIAKCGSGAATTADCTTTGENPNPSITFDVVTTLFKHDGTKHWAMKAGNAKAGTLAVSADLPTLPKGYSPLKQEGGLGLGEGGAGDSNGTGGFSEGAVMAAETADAVDNAIQKSIVSVYGK